MGCAQILNILTRESEPQIRPYYTTITFCNPFFNVNNGWIINKFAPILYFVERNLLAGCYLPEIIQKESEFPSHILPVHYDFDNPLQRRFIPLRTVVELMKISQRFEKLIYSDRKQLKRVKKPILIITGSVDKIVCNKTTDVMSALMTQSRS